MSAMTLKKLQNMTCCQKGGCFRVANGELLLEEINSILSLGAHCRREEISTMLGSDSEFYFDGKKVCSGFLLQAFHFSKKPQASVRNGSYFVSLELPTNVSAN